MQTVPVTMDTSYLYSLDEDFFDFGDPSMDYADSLDSPCSTGSDIENQIVYDPNAFHQSPFDDCDPCGNGLLLSHHNNNNNNGTSNKNHKGGVVVKKVVQRKAANQRERRRMKSINDAFETLRTCIPSNVQAERRLSKVDTLRLAIRYIGYLADVVQSCDDYSNSGAGGQKRVQEKVILRCHFAEPDSTCVDGQPLLGHSLSWDDPKGRRPSPDSKLVAKVWVPENPTDSDLINLAAYSTDY